MRKLLVVAILALFPAAIFASPPSPDEIRFLNTVRRDFGLPAIPQGGGFGQVPVIYGTGAPAGGCNLGYLYTNNSNGNVYACNNGIWVLAGGGGGVSSISATAPVVVTPNPITGVGTVSCPTCNTGAANTGGTFALPICGTLPNCTTIHDDGQVAFSPTCANTSTTVAVGAGDPPFVPGDVGKIIWATTAQGSGGASQQASIRLVESTILTFTDSTHVVVSNAATGTCSTLVWGTLDASNTGAGGLKTAWDMAINACQILNLPRFNAENTQTAYMLVEGDWSKDQPSGTAANCGVGTGANRSGIGVLGGGMGQTVFITTPNFDSTTCTGQSGPSNNACFFYSSNSTPGGKFLSGFSVWGTGLHGGGNGGTSGPGKFVMTFGAQDYIEKVGCLGWLGGAGSYGMQFIGNVIVSANFVQSDGCGNAPGIVASGSAGVFISGPGSYFGDSLNGFEVDATLNCSECGFGPHEGSGAAVVVGSTGDLYENGDYYFTGGGGLSGQNDVELLGGSVHWNGVYGGAVGATSGTIFYVHGGTTSKVYLTNSHIGNLNGGSPNFTFEDSAATATIYDSCGNTAPTGTFAATGVVFVPCPTATYASNVTAVGATGTGACGTITTIVGTILSGSLKCTAGTAASTIVLTPGITATNGWTCTGVDLTTNTNTPLQTASSTTTCTLGATSIAANDVIAFTLRQF